MLQFLSLLTCFKQTTSILGDSNDLSITLTLELVPDPPKLCTASAGTNSSAIINFAGQKISKSFIFEVENQIEIQFNLSADITKFSEIFKTSTISYEVLLAGSLSTVGPIQKINLIKLDISNCWGGLKMEYQMVAGRRFVAMVGEPRRCNIQKPEVSFQYSVENEWRALKIQGSSDGAGYFNENDTYDYAAITNYKQPETADNKDIFDYFFNLFMDHRNTKIRFVFTNADLVIVNNIQLIQSADTECLVILQPKGFLTKDYIDVGLQNFLFESAPSCVSGAAYFKAHVLLSVEGTPLSTPPVEYDAANFRVRFGIQFDFANLIQGFQYVDNADFQLYLTAFDADGGIMLDTSYSGQSVKSCVDYFNVKLLPKQACISINFYATERCSNLPNTTFDMSFTSQLDGFASRTTFFNYAIEVVPSSRIQVVCSSTLTDKILGMNSTLPMSKRYKAFADLIKHGKNIYTPLTSDLELINWSVVNLEIQVEQLAAFIGICMVIMGSMIAVVVVSIRSSQ